MIASIYVTIATIITLYLATKVWLHPRANYLSNLSDWTYYNICIVDNVILIEISQVMFNLSSKYSLTGVIIFGAIPFIIYLVLFERAIDNIKSRHVYELANVLNNAVALIILRAL